MQCPANRRRTRPPYCERIRLLARQTTIVVTAAKLWCHADLYSGNDAYQTGIAKSPSDIISEWMNVIRAQRHFAATSSWLLQMHIHWMITRVTGCGYSACLFVGEPSDDKIIGWIFFSNYVLSDAWTWQFFGKNISQGSDVATYDAMRCSMIALLRIYWRVFGRKK